MNVVHHDQPKDPQAPGVSRRALLRAAAVTGAAATAGAGGLAWLLQNDDRVLGPGSREVITADGNACVRAVPAVCSSLRRRER
jgi:hypothetical protein